PRGRPHRASPRPRTPPADPPIAVGASPVHALSHPWRADYSRAGRHGRRPADGGQAPRRGARAQGAAIALVLVLARVPRRPLAVHGSRGRSPARGGRRRLLRMTIPRLLVIMGSGETAPTMVTPHRDTVARFGAPPRAVLLDTPYGFQENAAEISQRAIDYFAQR